MKGPRVWYMNEVEVFTDWLSGRAYRDNAGNYRLRPADQRTGKTRNLAPWNKAAKHWFKDAMELHRAAVRWRNDLQAHGKDPLA